MSAEALRALEAGDEATRAHFARHLAEECEVCERFLQESAGPGLLDGQVDRLLLSLAPPAERPLDEVGFARIRRALAPPARRRWVGAGAAALAAGLVAMVAVRQLQPPPLAPQEQGVKGAGRLELELSVAARSRSGALRRLDAGAPVQDADVLLLRYHATEAGTALLFQQRAGSAPELLGRFPLEAGTHDLAGDAGLAGVGLQGERGPLRLLLVGLPAGQPVEPEAVRRALAGDTSAPRDLGLQVSRFDVRVGSGENAR
ncbi:hypothetical protein FGE12_09075 [Aggregicoccus sp. 17bor-14]|nr:hypothetical protein [Simulacricoccus sp. 17bor-14]MRI88321.1 hypothetical protein [Aggregicoccus sp. 17bor-14]